MDKIASIPIFEDCTDDELEWLIASTRVVELARGEYFLREHETGRRFYVVLDGELQITRTINGQETVMGTTPRGIIGGELSLLSGSAYAVNAVAIVPARLMVFDLPVFREMFSKAPTVGMRVLRIAAERMSGLAGYQKQQEKMAALGKLSAGLAHELNNPAAAARRAAQTLRQTLPALEDRSARLGSLCGSDQTLDEVLALQQRGAERAATTTPLSTLEQADREEELGSWLEQRTIADPWDIAPTLVAARISIAELEALLKGVPPGSANELLRWLHDALVADTLLSEIDIGTRRIVELVSAIKSYTYMDQAPLQEVDLHKGLEDTLAVMHHKLKAIQVLREYDPQLPKIQARGGELNQVWTNIIDNAIDALNGTGTIRLITRHENAFVMVEISDNGPGIPADALPHIFEPFFTTKAVGVGTGLGLDISYRIVKQHHGSIEVHSQPGQTRFIIRLPISGQA